MWSLDFKFSGFGLSLPHKVPAVPFYCVCFIIRYIALMIMQVGTLSPTGVSSLRTDCLVTWLPVLPLPSAWIMLSLDTAANWKSDTGWNAQSLNTDLLSGFHATVGLWAFLLTQKRLWGWTEIWLVVEPARRRDNQFPTHFFSPGISGSPKTLQGSVIFLHRDEFAHLEKVTGAVRLHRWSAM